MPANTITEVIQQLNEIIIRSAAAGDRIGYFAALYKRVTVAVANKIKDGYFEDGPRMEKLDVVFANRYLQAYECYTKGSPCSGSWTLAFDTAKSWRPMVIHHLLAGMNAHISLDLGIAAATVAPGAGVSAIQNDFNKINDLLTNMVEEIKTDLFSLWPSSKYLVKFNTGKFENELAGFSMIVAREAAWQQATGYAPLTEAAAQQLFISGRDNKVTAFGNKFLYPGGWVQTVMGMLRVFEFGSVTNKIKKLNRR